MKKRDAIVAQVIIGTLALSYVVGGTWIVSSYEKNFASINNTANQALAADIESGEPIPVITNMYPVSGPFGTLVEIEGENLLAPQDGAQVYVENTKGQGGFFLNTAIVSGDNSLIRFKVENYICGEVRTSLGECNSPILLTPALYRIYTIADGIKSNVVRFTVTKK